MWTLFVRALQGCGSTVEAAVANSGSNFIFTVCVNTLFQELECIDQYLIHNLGCFSVISLH